MSNVVPIRPPQPPRPLTYAEAVAYLETQSLYDIPPGCICQGDGLMGMKCEAPEHARLKP